MSDNGTDVVRYHQDRYNDLYGFDWDPVTGHGTISPKEVGSVGWGWATAIVSVVGLFSNWVLFWGIMVS